MPHAGPGAGKALAGDGNNLLEGKHGVLTSSAPALLARNGAPRGKI